MRRVLLLAAIGAVAVVVVGVVWFQPQKLFIDETVDETPAPRATMTTDDGMEAVSFSGAFTSIEHETTGRAIASEGLLRLEDFETSNGPDVRVWLSAGQPYADDHIDLGALKGNIGDQNYEIPEGTDLERYDNVVIWCRRFTVGFGAAAIKPA
jgi:hypothetical protein